MDCTNAQELLSPYLDGELNTKEEAAFKEHLNSCLICQEDLAALKETVEMLRSLSSEEIQAPPMFKAGVLARVGDWEEQRIAPKKRKWYLPALGAAAVIAALFFGSGILDQTADNQLTMAQNDMVQSKDLTEEALPETSMLLPEDERTGVEENMASDSGAESSTADQAPEIASIEEGEMGMRGFASMPKEASEVEAQNREDAAVKQFSIAGQPVDELKVLHTEIKLVEAKELPSEFGSDLGAAIVSAADNEIQYEVPINNLELLLKKLGDYGKLQEQKQFTEDLSEQLREERLKLLELEKRGENLQGEDLIRQREMVAELESRKGKAFVIVKLQ